ncbi:MAG TPA: DUF6675 family protein [Candidatus Limnocylindria bacterium]|jgi:hypothetical protein|nr:DUF6675 family protein [Candidatus Limnocylindria bacterium]
MFNRILYRRLSGVVLLLVFTAIPQGGTSIYADTGPQPPCESVSIPPYPDVDNPPGVRVWDSGDLGRDWAPPACTGWTSSGFTEMVAVAGRFRYSEGVTGLLLRIGAISGWRGIRYWSTTHKQWRRLILDACTLSGPEAGDMCREDFTPGDMAEGRTLYFRQEDNLFGTAVYRMRIIRASPDRLVFDTENTGPVRKLLVPLFHPGEIQSLHFLEREPQGVWRYYGIMRTGKSANPLTAGHEASYVNRTVAFYRYLAGIPTDKEPPASP